MSSVAIYSAGPRCDPSPLGPVKLYKAFVAGLLSPVDADDALLERIARLEPDRCSNDKALALRTGYAFQQAPPWHPRLPSLANIEASKMPVPSGAAVPKAEEAAVL